MKYGASNLSSKQMYVHMVEYVVSLIYYGSAISLFMSPLLYVWTLTKYVIANC